MKADWRTTKHVMRVVMRRHDPRQGSRRESRQGVVCEEGGV